MSFDDDNESEKSCNEVSSNEEAPSSSDDEDDPFSYKARSFNRRRRRDDSVSESEIEVSDDNSNDDDDAYGAELESSARKKSRGSDGRSMEQRLSALKNRKKPTVLSVEDSDDESDEEANKGSQNKKETQNRDEIVVLDNDSDDSDDEPSQPNRAALRDHNVSSTTNAAGLEAILKAREARRALVQAQQYHGEDIRVAIPQPPHIPINPMVAALGYQQISPAAVAAIAYNPAVAGALHNPASGIASLGGAVPTSQVETTTSTAYSPTIMLALRTIKSGCEAGTPSMFSVRQGDPLQLLVDKYLKANKGVSRAAFKFDGKDLDLRRSAVSQGLENEDLVDVVVKAGNLGPEILLTLRVNEGKKGKTQLSNIQDVLSIRMREPLSVLVEKFKKKRKVGGTKKILLNFDGQTLKTDKTPEDFEMENDDLIDVSIRG